HQAPRVDAGLPTVQTRLDKGRQIHSHRCFDHLHTANESCLLHAVTGDAEGEARANDLALPAGPHPGQRPAARILQMVAAAAMRFTVAPQPARSFVRSRARAALWHVVQLRSNAAVPALTTAGSGFLPAFFAVFAAGPFLSPCSVFLSFSPAPGSAFIDAIAA